MTALGKREFRRNESDLAFRNMFEKIMEDIATPKQRSNFVRLQWTRLLAHACAVLCTSMLFAASGAHGAAKPADDPDISANVIQSVDAARAGNPLWMPKFRKLSYTFKTRKSGPDGGDKVTTLELEAQPHGLLRMTAVDGSKVAQVLSFAGLVTLKLELTGSEVITTTDADGRVLGKSTRPIEVPALVARKVGLELPAELKPGAVFKAGTVMVEKKPGKTDYTDRDMLPGESRKCEVKERLDASAYFSSLTGKAVGVDCLTYMGLSDIPKHEALVYFEDLGLFVDLGRQPSDGSPSTIITDMKIER